MKHAIKTASIAWAATIALMGPLHAADIDLFTTTDGNSSAPNVYLMIDNSGNWNATINTDSGQTKKKLMEHNALKATFVNDSTLVGSGDSVKIRLGLGLFAAGNSPKGGVVYEHVEDLSSGHQDTLDTKISQFVASGDPLKTNNAPYALSFNEAYRYFGRLTPQSGDQNDDIDHDPDAIDGDTENYNTPAAGNCGKNFVILMGNGKPDSGEDNTAEDKLTALGGKLDGDPIDIEPKDFASNWSDEYARFMAGTDVVPEDVAGPGTDTQRGDFEQDVRTYVIDVFDPAECCNRKFEAARTWMKSIARWGDGRYFAASSEQEIKDALNSIINEILAVNSVFASSTLPVSVNVRGTNLNQVYMGVFRPSGTNQTRWQGNLKLYQLAVDEDTNSLFLADQNGDEAQSSATGFIKNEAVSFWTDSSTYWDYDPRGIPKSGSDKPDGPVVEKGGAHQRLRDLYSHSDDPDFAENNRPLLTLDSTYSLTCGTTGGCDLVDLSVNQGENVSETLEDWVHGQNNVPDDTTDPDTKTDQEPRPSVHGDVLHSKPAVVNYGDTSFDGSTGDQDIYVFYGANDGIFHALEGGKADSDGKEVWGFVPREFFSRLDELRDRATGKEYFADGGVGVLKKDQDGDGNIEPGDGDKVHLFIGMRRGGRLIYALDVSNPNEPDYLWKATQNRAGYANLGQTWSAPTAERIRYTDASGSTVEKDVLVFGGGYDPTAEDPENTETGSDVDNDGATMGQAIFVVDAATGDVIWKATKDPDTSVLPDSTDVDDMRFPIPSDVTPLDRDGDGFVDRIYVGDTGGQVWRADIDGAPETWGVRKLASVGEAAGRQERKFLFPPDIVFDEERDGTDYDAVLLGSGDREAPFKEAVTNRFYMFKDKATRVDEPDSRSLPLLEDDPATTTALDGDLYDATDNLIQDGTSDQQTTAESELNDAEGWFITLENPGEKVVSSAVTISGTTFFNTNEPPDSQAACGQSLGTARFYEVAFDDGTATAESDGTEGLSRSDRTTKATGGGFPPSPVPVIVEIDGKKYQAVISGTETKTPPGASLGRRYPGYRNADVD